MFPNIATPRYTSQQGAKHIMSTIEAMWLYKHAWRGAGLYYCKGDHLLDPAETEDKRGSMCKALSMYPAWNKWIVPRCEPVDEVYYGVKGKWSITNYDYAIGHVCNQNLFHIWYKALTNTSFLACLHD